MVVKIGVSGEIEGARSVNGSLSSLSMYNKSLGTLEGNLPLISLVFCL